MATLIGAMELLRGRGQLPPSGTVNVMDLLQRFRPSPPGSIRALLLKMFDVVAVKLPWAVILCRFKGSSPDPVLEEPIKRFYCEAFTPSTGGLVEFWRDASLGAIDITGSRVFGWVEVDITRAKAGGVPPDGPGRSGLIDHAIKALKHSEGEDVLHGFLGPMIVYTQNWSKDGAPEGADWSTPGWFPFWIDGSASGGKVCLTPPHNGNIAAHEMGHVFDMQHDVGGEDLKTHYADPCCIMSQNGAFTHPRWGAPFGTFGPALCLPHLVQRDWMYKRRVYYDAGGWLSQPDGITLPLAPISSPSAHANLGIKLAYTPGNWDYYLEYVIPTEWNRGVVGAPYLFIRRIVDSDVGPTPAYLGAIAIGTSSEFVEPSGNVRFRVEQSGGPGPILMVSAKKL